MSTIASIHSDITRWSVVVVGTWNQAIFTPEWTKDHVFPSAEELVSEMGLSQGSAVRRFTSGDVRLIVFPAKVQFHPLANGRETLERVESTAIRFLERLRDTPVTAFGVNFGFDSDAEEVVGALLASDAERLAASGSKVEASTLRRRLLFRDHVVNLTLSREGALPVIKIDLNHHFQIGESTDEVSRQLRGTVLHALDVTTALLLDAYSLGADVQ